MYALRRAPRSGRQFGVHAGASSFYNNKNRLPNRAIPHCAMPARILKPLLLLPLLTVSGVPAPQKKKLRGELKALEPFERDSNAVTSAEAPGAAKDLERASHMLDVPKSNRCYWRVDTCGEENQEGLTHPDSQRLDHVCSTYYCAQPRCSRDSASTHSSPPHMLSSLACIAAPHVEPLALRPHTVERGTPPPAQRALAWRHIDRPANRPFARRL